MPVVTVAAPPHPAIGDLLSSLADALADALGLGHGDVVVTHLPAGMSAVSGGGTSTWAIVVVHGSDRGRERMAGALAAAEAAASAWSADHADVLEGVWSQWQLP